MDDSEEARKQMELFLFYQKKREQEEEDIRLAMELQKQLEAQAPAPEPPKEKSLSDSDYARMLAEEWEKEATPAPVDNSADSDFARRLYEEELNRNKPKVDEFEAVIDIIKNEAKAEADEKLALALKEKEELERALEEARRKKYGDGGGEGRYVPKDFPGVEYPDHWEEHTEADFQVFEVIPGTPEWNRVVGHFEANGRGLRVTKLERNQNRTQWMFYYLKRQLIASKSRHGANEKMLFHGSRAGAYASILTTGFDHRVANMGGSIGAGTYFATHSSYSKDYTTENKMLYCRVTVGNVGRGQSGIRLPPAGCHSVANVSRDEGMYVVFDNQQAYPEYMIYYQ